jgi:hypothetical protein
MKGRVLGSLFAMPFAAVGVFMLWSVGSTLTQAWQMQGWLPVSAQLLESGYRTNTDDTDTYQAYATYRYDVQGQWFTGHRVGINDSADNIGDFHRDMGRSLQSAQRRNEPILVYVNPSAPDQAVIHRDVRWGLVGFKMIFVVVFGGVGFGLLIAIWRAPAEKDKSNPRLASEPWLLNDDWQTETIRSNARSSMWGAWAFAIFWNAIASAAPFLAWREIVQNENWLGLIALTFPLVGIGLLGWAIRRTLEWRRFGPAPVTLDPFPGSIGGHAGGTIDLNLPFDPNARFQLTLTNIHSRMSGSGKNRSRKESARWQDAIVAHAEPSGKGTRLTFRFEVPEGLNESDAEQGESYHLWRLNLAAAMAGTDLDRDYEIPVYATARQSRRLAKYTIAKARQEQATIDDQAVRKIARLSHAAIGKRMFFPMGRFFSAQLGGILVGVIFAAAGWYLAVAEGHAIFGSIFGGVGGLIGLSCLYLMCNSLEVVQTNSGIRTIRRLLGIPIARTDLQRGEIVGLAKKSSFKTQSGGRHIVYYNILATDRSGGKHIVGEGFEGAGQAKAAIRLITREFNLPVGTGREPMKSTLLGPEALS